VASLVAQNQTGPDAGGDATDCSDVNATSFGIKSLLLSQKLQHKRAFLMIKNLHHLKMLINDNVFSI